MSETVVRGLVQVDGRAVAYRRLGSGPVLIALHGSPESAKALEALMRRLAHRFTVIGIDTPGNGDSAPLPLEEPESEDYAEALLATLDALGLSKVALYGFHTGAGTALAAANQAPDRITSLILDGYAIWTEDERAVFLDDRYLAPFTPTWDGAHLATLWSRVEEQSIFFPYYDRTINARIPMTLPDLAERDRRALDWMKSGDGYRNPYAAAFRRRGLAPLQTARVPTLLGASPPDPLTTHLDRAVDVADTVTIERWADREAAFTAMEAYLSARPGDPPPETLGAGSAPDGVARGYAAGLAWRGALTGSGRPLVLIHDAGGSSALFAPTIPALAGARPVVAIDLPGHGLSDEVAHPSAGGLRAWAEPVRAALADLGLKDAAVAGFHLGGLIATRMMADGAAHRAGLIGAPVYAGTEASELAARYLPDLTPSWEGAHLARAWRMLTRQAVFFPWYAADQANALATLGALAPDVVQRRLVDLMRARPAAKAAYALQFTTSETTDVLAAAGSVDAFTLAWDPLGAPDRIASLREIVRGDTHALPAKLVDWGEVFEAWAL